MSLSVLLVEDDAQLRRTLRDSLQVEGYGVSTAATLREAHAVLKTGLSEGGLDLVLLDLGLPDGEGESLLGILREQRKTAVIVISARHSDDPKIRLLDAGADYYLVKPFSVKELLARMRLARRHLHTPGASPTQHYPVAWTSRILPPVPVSAPGNGATPVAEILCVSAVKIM